MSTRISEFLLLFPPFVSSEVEKRKPARLRHVSRRSLSSGSAPPRPRRSKRTVIALSGIALLAGCGESSTDTTVLARVEANQSAEAADDGRVQCALAGAEAFARVCQLDREDTEEGLILTISHPDGGFHRLRVTKDGRGVVAADGAEPATVTIVAPNEIEVAIGDDTYRLPATVRGAATKRE